TPSLRRPRTFPEAVDTTSPLAGMFTSLTGGIVLRARAAGLLHEARGAVGVGHPVEDVAAVGGHLGVADQERAGPRDPGARGILPAGDAVDGAEVEQVGPDVEPAIVGEGAVGDHAAPRDRDRRGGIELEPAIALDEAVEAAVGLGGGEAGAPAGG